MSKNLQGITREQLQNCEDEPLHIIGLVQSIGYIIVLDVETLEIVQVSENIDQLTGEKPKHMVGASIDEFFSTSFLHGFENLLETMDLEGSNSFFFEQGRCDYIVNSHLSDDYLVLEIEKDQKSQREKTHTRYSALIDNIVQELDGYDDINDICKIAIEKLSVVTGFNRLMVYRFDEDDHGEVIAEKKTEEMPSYMGLKFPSSDIPAQARKLYVKNIMRGIWNVDDEPSPIIPERRKKDDKLLDLSSAFLRSVSPVHITYLKNMGVQASFSISIVIGGKLWGLILCHHTENPLQLDIHQRRACMFTGKMLAYKIETIQSNSLIIGYRKKLSTLQKVLSSLQAENDIHNVFKKNEDTLLNAFNADGYAFVYNGRSSHSSSASGEWTASKAIDLLGKPEDEVFYSHHLQNDYPELGNLAQAPAGILVIRTSNKMKEGLLLFRKEQIHEVNWAGKQEKNDNQKINLTPRNSFEKWSELIKGQSTKWSSEEIQFAEEFRMSLIENIIAHSVKLPEKQQDDTRALKVRLIERMRELETINQLQFSELLELRALSGKHNLLSAVAEEKRHLRSTENFA